MREQFSYGKDHLTCSLALALADGKLRGQIEAESREKIERSAQIVLSIASKDKAVYGINTGFGPLCDTRISSEELELLQSNILKSHSVGMGENTPDLIVKLMLILKVHSLAKGFSGIQAQTIDRILWHIENELLPVVPQQGSVGASGDLAPLAHLFLPLIGLGTIKIDDQTRPTSEILKQHGLEPIQLSPKEGLALINGTQFIAAHAIKVVDKLQRCLDHADLIGAMMIDGLKGSSSPFLTDLHNLRPYPGTKHVAERISGLLKNSEILQDHENCDRVQDPYSLRCIPQVHGASRAAWLHLKELVEVELNSVTDNPVIIHEALTISGGNFHGQPLALPLDYACLAAAEIGSISERRTYLSLTGIDKSVPRLLMKDTGTNSAFMMVQYTAAALASENKGLCFPASADSIPTSLGQEDHVSMGSIGGRKALQVVKNVEKILAIEMLCAAQALDFHRPLKSSQLIEQMHGHIRASIDHASTDRIFATDMEKSLEILHSGKLLDISAEMKTSYSEFFDA